MIAIILLPLPLPPPLLHLPLLLSSAVPLLPLKHLLLLSLRLLIPLVGLLGRPELQRTSNDLQQTDAERDFA